MAVIDWAMRNAKAYFDNPTARRDYRSQLRGPRSVVFFGLYLAALIVIAVTAYSTEVIGRSEFSLASAQSALQNFYEILVGLLAGALVLAGPALAATAVVAERDRRSLDLVFSAPVSPKSFLLGKLISAYRSMWMLLVLALPVAAICVVLGGTTWVELLATFALLSLHGLIYAAIAIAISSVMVKPVSSIFWSYVATGFVLVPLTVLSLTSSNFAYGVRYAGEGSALSALSPFTVIQASRTYTVLPWFGGTAQIPNWIFTVAVAAVAIRLLLLAAGSALSPYGAPETRNLRWSGLATFAIFALFTTFAFRSSAGLMVQQEASARFDAFAAFAMAALPLPLALLLPILVPYGRTGERKFQPDGVFSFKSMIKGTPAGSLPYLASMVAIAALVALIAFKWTMPEAALAAAGTSFLSSMGVAAVWSAGFWTFCWSLGRLGSALYPELRTARVFHLVTLVTVFALPVPFLALFTPYVYEPPYAIDYHPFGLFWARDEARAVIQGLSWGLGMLALGVVIAVYAENRARAVGARMARVG